MSKFLLKLDEYNRIHQVVHGVVKDEGDAGRACTFFAMIGSLILNKHYGIAARPVAGAFLLCVEPGKNVVYGRDDGGKIGFDQDAFHMWVQTETHIIDFMAPIFRESFAAAQPDIVIPRKMFQKRISDESSTVDAMQKAGDYFTLPDPELSEHLTDYVLSRPLNTDFIEIADHWYGSRRSKQRPTMTIGSNDGIVRKLTLPDTAARGAW